MERIFIVLKAQYAIKLFSYTQHVNYLLFETFKSSAYHVKFFEMFKAQHFMERILEHTKA